MHFGNLFTLSVLVGAAIAVPGPVPRPTPGPIHKLVPEPPPAPLNYDDIVLFNNIGSYSVIKEFEFQKLLDRGDLVPAPPPTPVQPARRIVGGKDKRQDEGNCEVSTEIHLISESHFLNWDVPMSPVVAALAATATASVMQGYTLTNYLTLSAKASGEIPYAISVGLDISYMRQWTSTASITFLFQVPTGNYGIVVSEPWTRRIEGFVLTGCTENPENISFRSDSYTDKNYGGLAWVDGVIRLCMSPQYPVPYCIGNGRHT